MLAFQRQQVLKPTKTRRALHELTPVRIPLRALRPVALQRRDPSVIVGIHWMHLRVVAPSERMVILDRCEALIEQHAAPAQHARLEVVEGELI